MATLAAYDRASGRVIRFWGKGIVSPPNGEGTFHRRQLLFNEVGLRAASKRRTVGLDNITIPSLINAYCAADN